MDPRNAIRKRYYYITILLFIAGLVLMLLPHRKNSRELSPENLLLAISTQDRFFSVDNVAKLIISGDPSIVLIDVRNKEEYDKYHLPKAINIPLDSLLNRDEKGDYKWEGILNQDIKTNIFYSNGSVYANQAWMLCRRMDFKNNYVMKGGLNTFFENIINAKKPLISAPQSEQNLFSFRKAASMYFGGGNSVPTLTEIKSSGTPTVKKKKEKGSSGGC